MGILVHPSYQDELANGVAVTFDPLSVNYDRYYVNTQLGEDLVTNPEAHSTPEELLLRKSGSLYVVLATSNLLDPGETPHVRNAQGAPPPGQRIGASGARGEGDREQPERRASVPSCKC